MNIFLVLSHIESCEENLPTKLPFIQNSAAAHFWVMTHQLIYDTPDLFVWPPPRPAYCVNEKTLTMLTVREPGRLLSLCSAPPRGAAVSDGCLYVSLYRNLLQAADTLPYHNRARLLASRNLPFLSFSCFPLFTPSLILLSLPPSPPDGGREEGGT